MVRPATMAERLTRRWLLALVLTLAALASSTAGSESETFFEPFNVSYDHRALILAGKRRMLISAGIHYPRATPDMWPALISKSKEGGAEVVQTYVFWNGHEPTRGQFHFEGRYDIVKFAQLIGSKGLYLHLRIGPYVCAEWNFGGLPVWLRDVPGIEFRTNNVVFKNEMKKFVAKIVNLLKTKRLFSWQGGPVILLQIENEYGNIQASYGNSGNEYIKWAARMALDLDAGVPWVMCKQRDAPEYVIDACNGFYCDGFKPNFYKKPTLWTEDWNGWYASWGGRLPHRPVEDNAFAVARFFERGGSFHNYYMFFGGTNFGRTAGGPLQITSYDYDAPIDEYGLINQPKWGHFKDLHAAIKLCEPALVAVDDGPQYAKLGPMQEAHIYSTTYVDINSAVSENVRVCSAFVANIDEHKTVVVNIFSRDYILPPWSVSILPDCKNVAFNTAMVGAPVSVKTKFIYDSPNISSSSDLLHLAFCHENFYLSKSWMSFKEPIGAWGKNIFTTQHLLDHLDVAKDTSDYLWYITSINVSSHDVLFWREEEIHPMLIIQSMRDVVRIFINGHLIGSKVGNWIQFEQAIHLVEGLNEIALLSETVGLQNYGAFFEKDGAGFRGQIKLTGLKDGEIDLSSFLWAYQVGLKGEHTKIYDPEEQKNADWIDLQLDYLSSVFTWYKTTFDAPKGDDPVALDLGSMGKGQAWVNGHLIGRYWSRVAPKDGCPSSCNYCGAYNENKCRTNCGKPTQSWYHIPRSWLQDFNNLLVIFEETGGNPLKIALRRHFTERVCAKVAENYYPPLHAWSHPDVVSGNTLINNVPPEAHLQCDDGYVISGIKFASFGDPHGSCGEFTRGDCHATNSLFVAVKACQGKNNCTIQVSNNTFAPDPCRGRLKTFAVEAECSLWMNTAVS